MVASTGAAYSHVSFYLHFFFWDTQDEGTQELALKSIFTKSDNDIFEEKKVRLDGVCHRMLCSGFCHCFHIFEIFSLCSVRILVISSHRILYFKLLLSILSGW